MTTRRLEDLPEQHATPILALIDAARAAAAPDGDSSAWAVAEAGQAKIRTTYKAPRRTATAGQIAAHALRLHTLAGFDVDAPAEPWEEALLQSTEAINSWDWDVRMQGALDLRRTYKDLERPLPPTAVPVQLVASWLTHAGGPELVPVTARLTGYVVDHKDSHDVLAAAWYATHGHRILAELAPTAPQRRGAPTTGEEQRRAALKTAVRGVAAAHIMTKVELAAAASTSRPTVTAWLSEA